MPQVLCVNKEDLSNICGLKKDIALEKLLRERTLYFPIEEIRENGKYIPLDFCTTVRSMYSNKVVYYKSKEGYRSYYMTLEDDGSTIHTGYDLVMYLSSVAIRRMVKDDCIDKLAEIMANHSTFTVRGIRYRYVFVKPIIYSQIVLEDKAFGDLEAILTEDFGTCTIKEMRERAEGNVTDLLDDIIEVKEGSK